MGTKLPYMFTLLTFLPSTKHILAFTSLSFLLKYTDAELDFSIIMSTPSASLTLEQVEANIHALLNGPAVEPPAGVTPNFVDPPNREATIFPIMALCLTIATLAVLVRLYSKLFLLRSVAYEDCEFDYSLVCSVAFES